jgi:hypothetical protein
MRSLTLMQNSTVPQLPARRQVTNTGKEEILPKRIGRS